MDFRVWLAMAIYRLIESRPELAALDFRGDHCRDVVVSATHVLASDSDPVQCTDYVIQFVEELMITSGHDAQQCVDAGHTARWIMEMAAGLLASAEEHGPDESGCDPGGGPMAPDDRAMDGPW